MEKLIVTGYVPIPNHPRTPAEYSRLSDAVFQPLTKNGHHIFVCLQKLEECWLWKHVHSDPRPTTHSVADNPAKNTLAYHCVQHQKFEWLRQAAMHKGKPKQLIWLDMGIAHVPGVTATVIDDYIKRVRVGDFAIPGCWPKENTLINEYFPCWRYCGGVMSVPADKANLLFDRVKRSVAAHLQLKRNVYWEVNTLAKVEDNLPSLRWYQADHNETMFTGYK